LTTNAWRRRFAGGRPVHWRWRRGRCGAIAGCARLDCKRRVCVGVALQTGSAVALNGLVTCRQTGLPVPLLQHARICAALYLPSRRDAYTARVCRCRIAAAPAYLLLPGIRYRTTCLHSCVRGGWRRDVRWQPSLRLPGCSSSPGAARRIVPGCIFVDCMDVHS